MFEDSVKLRNQEEVRTLLGTLAGRISLDLARHNDLEKALRECEPHRQGFTVAGRRACDLPVWLDGPPKPAKSLAGRAITRCQRVLDRLGTWHPLGLLLAGFLIASMGRKLARAVGETPAGSALRWLLDVHR